MWQMILAIRHIFLNITQSTSKLLEKSTCATWFETLVLIFDKKWELNCKFSSQNACYVENKQILKY